MATHGRTILLQRDGCPDKFPALLLSISQQVDLAILTVPDDTFWDSSAVAVVLGDAPRMQQSVEVIGYPTPGDSVCITQGDYLICSLFSVVVTFLVFFSSSSITDYHHFVVSLFFYRRCFTSGIFSLQSVPGGKSSRSSRCSHQSWEQWWPW